MVMALSSRHQEHKQRTQGPTRAVCESLEKHSL